MFDRRTLLALVVVGLILLLLPKYYELISPKKPVAVTNPSEKSAPPTPTDSIPKTETAQAEPAKMEAVEPKTSSQGFELDSFIYNPDYVTIETPLYSMKIGSNGQASQYILKNYTLANRTPIELHRAQSGSNPTVGYVDFDLGRDNAYSLKKLNFKANKTQIDMYAGADSVTLIAIDSVGRSIALTYIIDADKYGFDLSLATTKLAVTETGEYKIQWKGGIPLTEPDPSRDLQYAGAYAKIGDAIEKVTVGSDGRKDFTATGVTYFLAARSKYFVAAIIPHKPGAGTEIAGRTETPRTKTSPHLYDLTLKQAWEGNAAGRWTIYWGPIKYNVLKSYGVGLEETMNWGWPIIKPFSKAILWALTGLHSVISNYGIVIILFSIMVKLILWPLTRKSQISMKKMAALQPEIQALRELHSKNSQALNQAIMALYKERGVNPASGCIPLLLQMPLLYALFVIFSTTIEFRQASFMLWITDLSQPDIIFHLPFSIPLYGAAVAVLPIIMGITQFIMSKRTTTDPNQKMMIYIMPVFMTLIFNNLPSGLTWYYTLFNVIAIVEQNLIKVPDFSPSVQVVEEKRSKR
jgi:YidC/Oxa1 family membrane protein insertase